MSRDVGSLGRSPKNATRTRSRLPRAPAEGRRSIPLALSLLKGRRLIPFALSLPKGAGNPVRPEPVASRHLR